MASMKLQQTVCSAPGRQRSMPCVLRYSHSQGYAQGDSFNEAYAGGDRCRIRKYVHPLLRSKASGSQVWPKRRIDTAAAGGIGGGKQSGGTSDDPQPGGIRRAVAHSAYPRSHQEIRYGIHPEATKDEVREGIATAPYTASTGEEETVREGEVQYDPGSTATHRSHEAGIRRHRQQEGQKKVSREKRCHASIQTRNRKAISGNRRTEVYAHKQRRSVQTTQGIQGGNERVSHHKQQVSRAKATVFRATSR